jgi:VWFA-related protein
MRKGFALAIAISFLLGNLIAQTPQQQNSPPPPQERKVSPEDILRIRIDLVQTDVVVMDKNEQIIPDLNLADFEVFENGKKQDVQFMEFISLDEASRSEGTANVVRVAPGIDTAVPKDVTAADLRRVIGFVVDDVTIPAKDMSRVRDMLTNFVDTKMREGDLVAIVRTFGGKGLLEQFTSDRNILRQSIAQLGVRSIPPYLAFGGPEAGRVTKVPTTEGAHDTGETIGDLTIDNGGFPDAPSEGVNQVGKSYMALSVSTVLVNSLREIPGRKNLVLLSGGLPMFDFNREGRLAGAISDLFAQLVDNATRSGVVVNTMDVRGLTTAGAIASFADTPAKSALGGGTFAGNDENPSFGRTADLSLLGTKSLTDQLSLRSLAGNTGGVSVVNSNNFSDGLDKILKRTRGYYRLAYKPTDRFDNKFRKVEVKVRRSGAQIFTSVGYFAREDRGNASATKEDQIVKAAISPLAKRDLDVTAELQYVFTANNQADLTVNAFINARKLDFKKMGDKYHASFDVVGFVIDQVGRSRGGISQTVNAELSEQNYQRALTTGMTYSANTQVPPGYYQMRLVIRENETGKMGTVSRYFEVPDLSQKQLMMSSILLYEISPTGGKKAPEPLPATRIISRKQDLRYATVIYNAKTDGGKSQVTSRLMISVGDKILFQEPEQRVETAGSVPGQLIRVGQLALAKVPPGRYVLSLVITDPQADKKRKTMSRSVDFTVVE